jgi:hypothetical protein
VLWPIDLINLPRRGPRPTLKNESRITIKVMDDLVIPDMAPTVRNQYGFTERPEPISYAVPQQQEQQVPIIIVREGGNEEVSSYKYAGNGLLSVVRAQDGLRHYIHMVQVDITATVEANRENGINFTLPGYQVGAYDSMLDVYGNGSQYPTGGFKNQQAASNFRRRKR